MYICHIVTDNRSRHVIKLNIFSSSDHQHIISFCKQLFPENFRHLERDGALLGSVLECHTARDRDCFGRTGFCRTSGHFLGSIRMTKCFLRADITRAVPRINTNNNILPVLFRLVKDSISGCNLCMICIFPIFIQINLFFVFIWAFRALSGLTVLFVA